MRKRSKSPMKLSLLSCAVAMVASGMAQSALAVDLCTGQASISVASAATGNNCTLDVPDAKLTVGAGRLIDGGVLSTTASAGISNSGTITGPTTAIWYQGVGLSATVANSGAIVADADLNNVYGLYVDNDVSGAISNSGFIGASANRTTGDGYATALYVGSASGSISNTGTIAAEANAIYYGSAIGAEVDGDLSGSLTNVGLISAKATGTSAQAYGLEVFGDVTAAATLTNTGTIVASGTGSDSTGYATALYVSGNIDGKLTNTGTINATAVSESGQVTAYALDIGGTINGTVANSGTISASAQAKYNSASAYGLYVSSGIGATGAVVNTGTISAQAQSGTSSAYAYAVEMGTVYGELTNKGTISASATAAASDATAYGMYLYDGMGGAGKLTNSGTITATADGDYAQGYGILMYGHTWYDVSSNYHYSSMEGTAQLVNDGRITVTSKSYSSDAYGYGIYLDSDMEGTSGIVNNGTVQVTLNGKFYTATGTGVYANDMYDSSSVLNNGTIAISATSGADEAYDYALRAGSLHNDATITNKGTLSATADAYSWASAVGIRTGTLNDDSVVLNSGTITAKATSQTSSAYAYGIRTDGVSNGALLSNEGSITAIANSAEYESFAYGIRVNGHSWYDSSSNYHYSSLDRGAELVNNGRITATAGSLGNASAYAYGISLSDSMESATLTNAGSITATAAATGAYNFASAYGIDARYMYGTSAISNTGTIKATASAAVSSASAYGIRAAEMYDSSSISNKGTITATATAGLSQGYAYGIYADSLHGAASITNEGTIRATAAGTSSASAYGIRTNSLYDGSSVSVTSTGVITAQATNTRDSSAYAYGISAGEVANISSITNAGLIAAVAVDEATIPGNDAYAYGIRAWRLNNGASVTNDGTLLAVAKSVNGYAYAYGMDFNALEGAVTNTGTIQATGNDDGGAYAIHVYGGSMNGSATGNGSVNNSGTLVGGVLLNGANYYYCTWYGCYSGGSSSVSLTNSGSITTFANSPSHVSGNYTQDTNGSLTFFVKSASTYGNLSVDGTADFTNSNAVVIKVDPKATLKEGDALDNVIVAGTLTAPTGFAVTDTSTLWNFETAAADGNSLDLIAHYLGATNLLSGTGVSGSGVALVDYVLAGGGASTYSDLSAALNDATTGAQVAKILEKVGPAVGGASGQASRVASTGANNAINARLAETRGASSGDSFKNAAVWIKPFLGKANQDDANGVSGYDVDTTGFVIGVDGNVTDAMRVGAAVASAKSDVSGVGSLDISSTQVSLYGSYAFDGRTALDVDLGYAGNGFDSRRGAVNGSTAIANYDGTQLSAGAALSRSYKLSDTSALIPSLSVRFSQVKVDGYGETGAGVYNLNVASSDENSTLVALKGTYEMTLANKGVFSANLGVANDSADKASATSSLSNGAGPVYVNNGIEPDSTVLTGGLGYRYVTSKNLEINAAYDLESRSDFLGQTLSVKFRVPF